MYQSSLCLVKANKGRYGYDCSGAGFWEGINRRLHDSSRTSFGSKQTAQQVQQSRHPYWSRDLFDQDEERHRIASSNVKNDIPAPLLVNLLDKHSQKNLQHVTVTDLVEAFAVTTNEIALIQSITVGQRDDPLWMDARQWRITVSNFGRVCNRQREPGYYPPSLLKLIITDYGQPVSVSLELGSSHEDIAIQTNEQKTGQIVYPCGFFISFIHFLVHHQMELHLALMIRWDSLRSSVPSSTTIP